MKVHRMALGEREDQSKEVLICKEICSCESFENCPHAERDRFKGPPGVAKISPKFGFENSVFCPKYHGTKIVFVSTVEG